ncbi:hypothetical protein HMPREF1025_01554, partial [Lachnospiraceae bacterium 3_1_46FAA]
RDITFYNKDFLNAHPNIIVEKKSDSPDEDKSLADSKALLPVLIDFFQKHPLINPKTFLGDAAFDTIEIYKALLDDLGFEKAFIPLRTKLSMEENGYTFNENGVPCCPHDSTLPMKREGSKSHLRSKLPSMKFVCPKMKWEYNRETKTKRRCSRSKFLSKLLKTFDKTFREIFPVFISTKRREKPSAFFDNNFVNNAYFSEAASSSSSHLASSSSKAPISSRMTCLCLWSS